MKNIGTICTLIVFGLSIWCAMNWQTIKTAWKYRAQIEAAADVVGSLQALEL
jgi:uncharacterized membrane protein YoaT (DUF817 family)